jgi:hypothetical protein
MGHDEAVMIERVVGALAIGAMIGFEEITASPSPIYPPD